MFPFEKISQDDWQSLPKQENSGKQQNRAKGNRLKITAVLLVILLTGPTSLFLGFTSTTIQAATPVWAPPAILLPYVADNPSLCINPLDSTISYLAASGGNGEASGSEGNNWLNGTFTKLSDKAGTGDCAFDEYGTLHAVWSLRNEAGNYNIYYNSVQKGSGNVPLYRNLTQELYGQDKYTIKADIAVSIPQHKVFITYQERRDGGDALMFIESATQGDTWSKPLQLGILSGYRPAEPDIIVDRAGLPHVFFGVFNEGGPSKIMHRMRKADGSWTAPENILGDKQTRPIWTQAELDPTTGDIYVSWLEVQSGVSRWNAATGQWSYSENISNSSARASFPTIAINSQTGTVWDFWTDESDIWARQSTDHGQTWQPRERVVNLGAAKIGRMFGIKARSTRGIIFLLISADQLDPLYYVGPTLQLMTFNQSITGPDATPTPYPVATGTPGGTTTPVSQPTLSPAPVTTGPTATPGKTSGVPTITPQPTPTLVPTVTPQPTVTPVPTVTPQPTATPLTFPTAVPTSLLPATQTPVPTAPTRPVAPTSTSTPVNVPAQVPGQSQSQNSQPTKAQALPTFTPTAIPQPSSTPLPTVTTAPEVIQATVMAQAQQIAASTPQSLVVPLAPPGSGGRGPLLVLPTNTPQPTSTAAPTVTAIPTATIDPYQLTVTAGAGLTNSAQEKTSTSTANNPAQSVTANGQIPAPTIPPPTGPLWLLPVGLAVAGKGLLNLLAFRLRP